MGGLGSGRRHYSGAKDTTDNYRALDIRQLHRQGLLAPGTNSTWSWSRRGVGATRISISVKTGWLALDYEWRNRGTEDWSHRSHFILLDWTTCRLGGSRPWFRCPVVGCGRRVAILYGGEIYACRHCRKLAYKSQRKVGYDRQARRADKIRVKLGWPPGILNECSGLKPKGMHWKTFARLVAEHDRLVIASLGGMTDKIRTVTEFLEDRLEESKQGRIR